jgi:hypothetical protein
MNAAFAEQPIRPSNVNFLYKANSMWSEGKDCVLSAYGKAIGQPIATIHRRHNTALCSETNHTENQTQEGASSE